MKRSDLSYFYPEELVATEPRRPSQVMWVKDKNPRKLDWESFLNQFREGDLIIVNDTQVNPLRVWATSPHGQQVDVLFVRGLGSNRWEVLAPTKKMKNHEWTLPDGIKIIELTAGIPQVIQLSQDVDQKYFEIHGEVPLPPYILKSRGSRRSQVGDKNWYRSIFAKNRGSSAAPTASLHFTQNDFDFLKSKNVDFAYLTLHVGLGTYLPVTSEDLDQHHMHQEYVHIPKETWRKVGRSPGRLWALGTTVTRALESASIGKLKKSEEGFSGSTDLLIQPGYDFKVVRAMMTNFHQPESTLLALVAAFAGLETVKNAYAFAIENKFRLFSYGDLSAWEA